MADIKCPHCGKVFKIDESAYTEIISHIKEEEIQKAVLAKEKELKERQILEINLAKQDVAKAEAERIQKLEKELDAARAEIKNNQTNLTLALSQKDAQFEKEKAGLKDRISSLENEKLKAEADVKEKAAKEREEAIAWREEYKKSEAQCIAFLKGYKPDPTKEATMKEIVEMLGNYRSAASYQKVLKDANVQYRLKSTEGRRTVRIYPLDEAIKAIKEYYFKPYDNRLK